MPAALFALALGYAAYVAQDLGRRYIAVRDRTRDTNEAMRQLDARVSEQLKTCDRAIGIAAKEMLTLESRIGDLETQLSTNEQARGLGFRRRPQPMEG